MGTHKKCHSEANEYVQSVFSFRNKKNINPFWLKNALIWSYGRLFSGSDLGLHCLSMS